MKYSSNLIQGICILLVSLSLNTTLISQCDTGCDIQCINQLNLSLNENCEAEVTPDLGGIGVTAGDPCYSVVVKDEHGRLIADNLVTIDYLNQNLTYEVTEQECGNLCWGSIKVEYKLQPQISCPDDLTISCNALDYLEFPAATGGCSAVTVQLLSQEKVHLDCDPLHQAYVDRTYVAGDTYGNTSTCSHRVYLKRIPISDILFPEAATISCSDTTMRYNAEGNPFPWYYQALTGSGTAMGIPVLCNIEFPTGFYCGATTGSGTAALPLIPNGGAVIIKETADPENPMDIEFIPDSNADLLCNAVLLYSDVNVPTNGGCKRKIIRTWNVIEWWCNVESPVSSTQLIEIVDDKAPVFSCPEPRVVSTTEDCAANIYLPAVDAVDECGDEVSVRIQFGNNAIDTNGGLATLATGPNVLIYTATDNCFNSSSCQTIFTVEDLSSPVAICERDKVVSLTTGYSTKVPAEVFDNGSFDDCYLGGFEVRRMDNICTAQDTTWSDYVEFCCADANQDVMVAMRISDASGNSSICMIQVEVQDKSVPNLTCPADMTVDCSFVYDADNLGATFGEPIADSNCASTQLMNEEVDADMSQCGIGTMLRVFSIQDVNGNVIRSCKQSVTVVNTTPFTGDQIEWPLDYEVDNLCDVDLLHPDLLPAPYSYPTFTLADGQCTILGFDYTDKVFTSDSNTDACAVIERTWIVGDWCADGNIGTWRSPVPQIIKIRNNTSPTLDDGAALTFETSNGDCNSGTISISRFAVDDCSNTLAYSYSLKTYPEGAVVQMGNTNELIGSFPTGTYTIDWRVSDGCGNIDTDVQHVSIVGTKAPTPICHNGLSASLVSMDTNGDGMIDAEMVELWASDIDAGSYPACNNPIALSFSSDTTDKVIFFDCDDLGRQDVALWVTDLVTGAQDFCLGFIEIQDAGVCPDGLRAAVYGTVETEEQSQIAGAEVALMGTSEMKVTDIQGSYAFEDMPLGGSYVVEPRLNKDFLNGVSTIDLIKIQRHILGLELLDSPYKLIAADINNSGNINGIDLVELRKLILGIYTELPSNDSWRFVSKDYTFLDEFNPWQETFDENYLINNLSSDMYLDFVGVKIGDVNNTAEVSTLPSPKPAVENYVTVAATHNNIAENDISIVKVDMKNSQLLGWQGTIEFDPKKLEILEVTNAHTGENLDANVFMDYQDEGWMTISYNTEVSLVEQPQVFNFVVRAKQNVTMDEDLLTVTSSKLNAEAYDKDGNTYGLAVITDAPSKSEILSVTPNPWISAANLMLYMSQASDCYLEFYNVNGQLIYNDMQYFDQGINNYKLEKSKLNTTGFIYIRMNVRGEISEYRMMLY